jgi:hypothetical protein
MSEKVDKRFQKMQDHYLQNRTEVSGRCMTPNPDPNKNDILFCSKLIMEGLDTPDPRIFCKAYINPDAMWRTGDCPASDEFLKTKIESETNGKKRVGQQKQKKRR